jgi:hypothetical protein
MPKDHARKKALASLKEELGIKHADAIALLDHPDPDERQTLAEYLAEYIDINTYAEAVAYLEQERPLNELLCEKCGWTVRMVCPECPGCGCYNGRCSGWRHSEYQDEMDAATGDYDPDSGIYCEDCGAGSSSPYDDCTCYYDDEDEGQEHEAAPAPDPERVELPFPGGWGSSSGPFSTSGWSS